MRYCSYDDKGAYDRWHAESRDINLGHEMICVGAYYRTKDDYDAFIEDQETKKRDLLYSPFINSKKWYLAGVIALKNLKEERPYDKRIPIAELCMLSGLRDIIEQVDKLKQKNWIFDGEDVEWNNFEITDKTYSIIDKMIFEVVNGMSQTDVKVQDNTELIEWCKESINSHDRALSEFKSGKESAINAFKGDIMKRSKGKYTPKMVDETLRSVIKEF